MRAGYNPSGFQPLTKPGYDPSGFCFFIFKYTYYPIPYHSPNPNTNPNLSLNINFIRVCKETRVIVALTISFDRIMVK